jgi:hypothetical protein
LISTIGCEHVWQWNQKEAADLLRLALTEADEDPGGLLFIVHAFVAAHDSLSNLGLSGAETLALSDALSKTLRLSN